MALPQTEIARKADTVFTMRPRVAPTLTDIFARAGIADDLVAVERRLIQRTESHSTLIAAAGKHTIAAGGKRLRAALVLLAARQGRYSLERALHPAAAVELLHGASLIHDDLVDHTVQRRGRSTVHARWDNHVALMLGDYFFAAAAGELAAEPDSRIIRFYADAARTIVEGELHPVKQLLPLDTALRQYRRKIGAKTAVLFEAACKAGIAVAGGSDADIDAMGLFGYELGVAFQIVDDVLDFTGDEAILGKPAGNDLREGTLTLPLIYAVDSSASLLLRDFARTLVIDPAHVANLVQAVLASDGVVRALDDAAEAAARALRHLDRFSFSPVREACVDLLQFVLTRQS